MFLCFTGSRFFCSQLIAPIRDENGDICLYILNFEDLSATSQDEASSPTEAANHLMSRCKPNVVPFLRELCCLNICAFFVNTFCSSQKRFLRKSFYWLIHGFAAVLSFLRESGARVFHVMYSLFNPYFIIDDGGNIQKAFQYRRRIFYLPHGPIINY